MDIRLQAPFDRETAKSLHAGDYVLISGTIYTARDAAHKRMAEALAEGKELPFDIRGNIIYYMGPSPAREGRPIGSAGPTTATRMDKYTPELLDLGGGEELTLVGDDHVPTAPLGVQRQDVILGPDHLRRGLQSDPGAQDGGPVPVVGGGLDEPDAHASLLVIEFGDEGLGRLAGAHGAILEIQFCHMDHLVCLWPYLTPKTRTSQRRAHMVVPTIFGEESCHRAHRHHRA